MLLYGQQDEGVDMEVPKYIPNFVQSAVSGPAEATGRTDEGELLYGTAHHGFNVACQSSHSAVKG